MATDEDNTHAALRAVAAAIAAALYWLVVLTLAFAQFMAICVPGAPGCPNMSTMFWRFSGVLAGGFIVFAACVWLVQRARKLGDFFASAVLAALSIGRVLAVAGFLHLI